MEDFFKKIIEGQGLNAPEICIELFQKNFEGAVNVEWFDRNTHYEAIFYKDNLEHIALFGNTGELLEYRMNLPVDYLPEAIKNYLENKGEIMNTVLKNKGNAIEYEVIVRDKNLDRFLVLLSDLGKVITEKQL